MVLELKVPGKEVSNVAGLRMTLPLLLVYLLSFVQTGIYWVNHHYLIDDVEQVTHGILVVQPRAALLPFAHTPVATNWVGTARHLAIFHRTLLRRLRSSRRSRGWSSPR
jgi:uncharacterized membrane protein